MRIEDLGFQVWCRNHPETHEAKWCRELYPWHVFAQLEYGPDVVGVGQRVTVDGVQYSGAVTKAFLAANGRPNYLVRLATTALSASAEWESRSWDDLFHLVTSVDNRFITLYTEERDPSKTLLSAFMRGDFRAVEADRSIPVSQLLFQSLVSYASAELFGQMEHRASFEHLPDGVRALPRHPQYPPSETAFAPLRSMGRDAWVLCAFREEKAHRMAFYNAAQCRRLVVVYCIPTFSQHHRCEYPEVEVQSLLSFVKSAGSQYVNHARALMGHLHADSALEARVQTSELEQKIRCYRGQPMPILASQLREAKAGLEVDVKGIGEAAYFFACANLLNAALTHRYGGASETRLLVKDVYSFKKRLWETMLALKEMPIEGLAMYVDPDGLAYLTVEGIQFSFHAVPPAVREAFGAWAGNARQEWSRRRLQPLASLVLDWGRAKMINGNAQR